MNTIDDKCSCLYSRSNKIKNVFGAYYVVCNDDQTNFIVVSRFVISGIMEIVQSLFSGHLDGPLRVKEYYHYKT